MGKSFFPKATLNAISNKRTQGALEKWPVSELGQGKCKRRPSRASSCDRKYGSGSEGDGDRPKGHTSQLEGAPSAQNEDSLSNKINDSVELQPIEQNES